MSMMLLFKNALGRFKEVAWKGTADGAALTADQSLKGIDNPGSATDSFMRVRNRWKRTVINTTAATPLSADGQPVIVAAVRVNGAANLGGVCTIAAGTVASNTEQDRLPSAATPGTERDFKGGTEFLGGCVITVATSGSVIALWREA